MAQPLTFAGPVSAVLYTTGSATNIDWLMRLSEVDSTGNVFPLAEGKIHARYRRAISHPEFLTPGGVNP